MSAQPEPVDLNELAGILAAPATGVAARLSAMIAPLLSHSALVILVVDPAGGQRLGCGDSRFVTGVTLLQLDSIRRTALRPSQLRREEMTDAQGRRPTLQAMSRNGALLVLADPGPPDHDDLVLQLWNVVAAGIQGVADAAGPAYLQRARTSSGNRMEALTELADVYSTTLESVLAALRSATMDDRGARQAATAIATEGLVRLRTASDGVRTLTEEPVTTAFERLRDDLRPLMRYRDIAVQFVEPPVDGRPLPSEVAHGARAVVRGSILVMANSPDVHRVRVQWDCDGTNLLIRLRDDGSGDLSDTGSQLEMVRQRVHALAGRLVSEATPGWGTELAITLPLDPPRAVSASTQSLSARELDIVELLVAGQRNKEMAQRLGISENTVKFHVSQILRKLDASTRAEAVAVVLSHRPAAL